MLPTSFNGGIGLPALMALMGHVTPEMTLRYAKLDSPTIRAAYQTAMDTLCGRQALPIIAIGGAPVIPRPDRMAAHRDAQDPPRPRLVLPSPGRRRLPLRQHLRAMRQLRPRPRRNNGALRPT
jgi:hypothetical protein